MSPSSRQQYSTNIFSYEKVICSDMFFAFPEKYCFDLVRSGKSLLTQDNQIEKDTQLLTFINFKKERNLFLNCDNFPGNSTKLSTLIHRSVTELLLVVIVLKTAAYVHDSPTCFRRKWRIGHVYQRLSTLWPITVIQFQQQPILMQSHNPVLAWEHSSVSTCPASRTSLVSSCLSVSHGLWALQAHSWASSSFYVVAVWLVLLFAQPHWFCLRDLLFLLYSQYNLHLLLLKSHTQFAVVYSADLIKCKIN